MDKPRSAAEYNSDFTQRVKDTCLYVATKLGDFQDDLVVVGGLVPTLLIRSEFVEPHVGTMDLDLGLSLAILDEARYRTLTEQLRGSGFAPDTNASGNPTRQRWAIDKAGKVTVDFLIPPTPEVSRGGQLLNIETDFAALVAPGLQLAFRDRIRVTLTGQTIAQERASRDIWVCGPGAYVVLKALAFGNRGENKDAYDLYYVIRNYGSGVQSVSERLAPMHNEPDIKRALKILSRDFQTLDDVGPRRVAEFIQGGPNDAIQADVAGFVGSFLESVRGLS